MTTYFWTVLVSYLLHYIITGVYEDHNEIYNCQSEDNSKPSN